MRINKTILFLPLILICLYSYGQRTSSSPYSFYGLGEETFKGNMLNRFTGGLDVLTDSIHVNINNPSSYANLKEITYSLGAHHTLNNIETSSDKENNSATAPNFIAIGIPTKKFGFGFGIVASTSVGFGVREATESESASTIFKSIAGNGGINKVYFSLGFNLLKNLSLGATVNYNFGNINYDNLQTIENIERFILERNTSNVGGLNYRFSLNYKTKIANQWSINSMISFDPAYSLNSFNERVISSSSTASFATAEQIIIDLENLDLNKTELSLPQNLSFGIGLKSSQWFIGTQYSMSDMSNFNNKFISLPNISYGKKDKISFGAKYVPTHNSISKYYKKINYMIGSFVENTGFTVSNQAISNYGITMGLSLPFPLSRSSNFNIGAELGQRGTTNNNLIQETYYNILIGLSLNDIWFLKRKYN